MELTFTKHALIRIRQRTSLNEIVSCLKHPDIVKQVEDTTVYLKLYAEQRKLLILPCAIENQNCRIITVIKTSQIKRYYKPNKK